MSNSYIHNLIIAKKESIDKLKIQVSSAYVVKDVKGQRINNELVDDFKCYDMQNYLR